MKQKIAYIITGGVLATSIVICIICNLAINKQISWSIYPIASIVVGYGSLSVSVYSKKNKMIKSILAIVIGILLALFLMYYIGRISSQFFLLAFIITILSSICLSANLYVIFNPKFSILFKASSITFLYSVILNSLINIVIFICMDIKDIYKFIVSISIILIGLIVSVVLFLIDGIQIKNK